MFNFCANLFKRNLNKFLNKKMGLSFLGQPLKLERKSFRLYSLYGSLYSMINCGWLAATALPLKMLR